MQIQCPSCRSYKVTTDRIALAALGLFFLLGGSLLGFLVIPLLGIPVGIFILIVAALSKPKSVSCRACHCKFRL